MRMPGTPEWLQCSKTQHISATHLRLADAQARAHVGDVGGQPRQLLVVDEQRLARLRERRRRRQLLIQLRKLCRPDEKKMFPPNSMISFLLPLLLLA